MCETCGQPLERQGTGRPRRYCSGRCRMEAHRRRNGVPPLVRRDPPPPRTPVCLSCTSEIPQPAQGRPRQYCGGGCRRNALQERLGRPGRHVPDLIRQGVVARDRSRCHICGVLCEPGHPDPSRRLTLDHLIPVSRGGQHAAENLAVACQSCNSRRGADRIPAQLAILG